MDLPDDLPPPAAIQNHQNENQKQKSCATTANISTNTNKNIVLFNKVTAPFSQTIKS